MGHLLGYARVSTPNQQPALQVDALQVAGCYRVFTETASGARADRPVLAQVLDQLRPGDTLVVWKLDRLGRSLRHLVDTVTGLAERGVGFRSMQEAANDLRCRICQAAGHPGGATGRAGTAGQRSPLAESHIST
jgi:DNA invertase Pin-like site-specific DNA recombinase